jgi:hypothetical protein
MNKIKTGFFDKNGKEVCLDDKVKWKDYDHFGCCTEHIGVVKRAKEGILKGEFVTLSKDDTGSYDLPKFEESELEIIYE